MRYDHPRLRRLMSCIVAGEMNFRFMHLVARSLIVLLLIVLLHEL